MDRRERIGEFQESLKMAMDGQTAQIWTALPAIIVSFNATAQTVTAQPAIQGVTSDKSQNNSYVNLPLLVDVPIQFITAGGYSITCPISVGDECLIVFASRCIDAWWQSGGVQRPMETRMHDLSDGFALIGVRSQARTVSNYDTNNLQIRSDDHNTIIEIDKTGKVNITAPTSMTVTSPSVHITGALQVDGAIASNVSVTAPNVIGSTNVTFGGKSGIGHTHSGVTTGLSNTGAPV